MTCKSFFDTPTLPITYVTPDTIYSEEIVSIFDSKLYEFDMIESEIITFNILASSATNIIDIIMELYIFNEVTGEYDQIGTSYITQTINAIDYDITPGKYAFCLKSSNVPVSFDLSLEFTSFPYIAMPIATAYSGISSYILDTGVVEGECNADLVFTIISGSLPPGIVMHDNGVIEGFIPELDCVTNNNDFFGLTTNYPEFEIEFQHGIHAYIYNYNPDDFVWFTGEVIDVDLFTNVHVGQEFISEIGDTLHCELTDYRQSDIYVGEIALVDFTTYDRVVTSGVNYNITDKIPPSFTLTNTEYGNPDEYYATQVEWEFIVRVAFLEDKSQYTDRFFKLCISNNWETDYQNFIENVNSFQSEVYIDESLENVKEMEVFALENANTSTDNEAIPQQSEELKSAIETALSENAIATSNDEPAIELCEPCESVELPRIREIDISGLCECPIDTVATEIKYTPTYVKSIPNYCGFGFVKSMYTDLACIPVAPCLTPTKYIKKDIYNTVKIEFEDKCLSACDK